MNKTDSQRKSNIDLLRIFASIAVIILHYNNFTLGQGLVISQGIGNKFLWFLEGLSICAVNVFVLMSGYLLSTTQKRDILKPVKLIIQVVIFNEAFYFVSVILGSAELSLKQIVYNLIPANWYVMVYAGLYLVSPYINIVLNYLYEKKTYKRFLFTIILLYSIYPMFTDEIRVIFSTGELGISTIGALGSQGGYTIINFIIMYIIGYALRRYDFSQKIKYPILLIAIFFTALVVSISAYFEHKIFNDNPSLEYCSPFVIAEAVFIFVLFTKMKFESKIINFLAKSAFTVYLIHINFIFHLKIDQYASQSLPILIIHLILSILIIYFAGIVICTVYDFIMKPLWKLIDKKRGEHLKFDV